ncbi:MAG TPA: amidohydrolase family protein [Lysobacter sp.]
MPAALDKWIAQWLVTACLLASMTGTAAAQAGPPKQTIAITDVTVIDLERGRTTAPRTVLIDDGRIVAIVAPRDARIPPAAHRVDGRGRFLMPGLVDMHVHLFNTYSRRPPNAWTFPLFIANGVTAVREMNADPASMAVVNQWRKDVDDGELLAPRILAVAMSLRGKPADGIAHQVDAAADAGADAIKVFSETPALRWQAILDAAQARSLPVVGHVPADVSLLAAATAGQRSNEHLMQAFEACSSVEAQLLEERHDPNGDASAAQHDAQEARALEMFDQRTCTRIGKALAATGQAQVPTQVLYHQDTIHRDPSPRDDPRWRYLRSDERARWERIWADAAPDEALAKRRWHVARKIASTFHRAGVPILSGTDTPMPGIYPGFSLHEELALLVESGLTPRDALRSATLAPAQFLGIAGTTGSVAVGKRADLLLLDADPIRDIRNTRRIRAVVLDGRLLQRHDLDALLEAAARAQTP